MSDLHAEPASTSELDPDEPHTPLWLPLLGLTLFLVALVVGLVSGGDPVDPVTEPGALGDQAAEAPEPVPPAHDDHDHPHPH
jgi:hypothetical protein